MHYLDNAATTFPKPPGVAEAMVDALTSGAGNPGRGGSSAARAATRLVEGGRAALARSIGANDARRVAFTLNATDALNLALRSLATAGRPIVSTHLEHDAVLLPLRRIAADSGAPLRLVRPGADGLLDPDDIRRAADGAAVVAMTCASNVLGVAQPWREVAAALAPSATPLVLDAAQAAGSLPLNFDELGPHVALALTGHKALAGPMGVGALVVGDALDLRPSREGGAGETATRVATEASLSGGLAASARLEAGTLPVPAIAGLAAALAWWQSSGPDVIRAREQQMLGALLEGLAALPGVVMPGIPTAEARALPRAPLVSFRVEGWGVAELATLLDTDLGITTRAGLACAPTAHRFLGSAPDGLVRASIGPMTTPDAVEALLDALRRITSAT